MLEKEQQMRAFEITLEFEKKNGKVFYGCASEGKVSEVCILGRMRTGISLVLVINENFELVILEKGAGRLKTLHT